MVWRKRWGYGLKRNPTVTTAAVSIRSCRVDPGPGGGPMSWLAIVVLVAGAYGFKALGVFGLARLADDTAVGGGRGLLRWFPILAGLIPPALFAALVAVQTLGAEGGIHFDARMVGVGAAGVAVGRRAPFIVVVVVAMTLTALVRWQT